MTYIFRRVLPYSVYFLPLVVAQSYTPSPRWAQAVALLESTLYIHGGFSDPSNSYSYSSAPELSDLLRLDFSRSFNASSPPWELLSSSASPALSWHTLSAFNADEFLLFGGQPSPNSQPSLTTLNDSAGLIFATNASSPYLLMQPQNWGNQPMRRIRHSASYSNGKVWVIGGEEADGSGNAFNEHYYFDPTESYFTPLPPSTDAPPDIYGHASFVLPDGRLLVLGGYCASCSTLVSMSTIWILDITQSPPSWDKASISNASLPNPRRDFASVVLADGQILIHGGGDATLQTTYSDGWLLDTRQNPMVWYNVPQLTQLGERKDHFAAQVGGYIFFCFGYGVSSPASASLFIYDPNTSSMVSSYTAPPPGSTPSVNPLPDPTGTGTSEPSSLSSAPPGSSSGSPPYTASSSSDDHHTAAIALGTVFGVLGLVSGISATIYYTKRVRGRPNMDSRFFRFGDDSGNSSEDESLSYAVPTTRLSDGLTNERSRIFVVPNALLNVLASLGIWDRPPQPRRDMFADEDTRSFGSEHLSALRREDNESSSAWSFRSMTALVRGIITRESSTSGAGEGEHEWEKIDYRNGWDQEALVRQGNIPGESSSTPSHRREDSYWSYTDPFQDPHPEDDYDDLDLRPGVPEKDADYDRPVPRSHGMDKCEATTWRQPDAPFSFSVPSRMLTPVKEISHTSFSEPSNSLPSLHQSSHEESTTHGHSANNKHPLTVTIPQLIGPMSPAAPRFQDTSPIGSSPQHSFTLPSTSLPSPSMSRSGSWWSRFAMPSLLDRRVSARSQRPLDFRDATPAPPLVPVEESKKLSPSCATPLEHDRSISSTNSTRTANTDTAEHFSAKYDVIQRLASDSSSSRRAPSLVSAEIAEREKLKRNPDVSVSNTSHPVNIPRSTCPLTDFGPAVDAASISGIATTSTPSTRLSLVSSRIAAYERRMSQEMEIERSIPPRNTRKREEVSSRRRPTIRYGIAPRASLFIANPDSEGPS